MFALKFILAAVLAAGAAALPATPSDKAPEPEWERLPNASQVAARYPARAQAANVGGWGVIACRVDASGKPYGCQVAAEAPDGYGFGAATVAVARDLKIKQSTEAPTLRLIFPMVWRLQGGRNPPRAPTPGASSFVVTIIDHAKRKTRAFACPSSQDPARFCQAHDVDFEKAPGIEQLADVVRKAGSGRSEMECTVGDQRELKDCVVSNNGPQLTEVDFYNLSTMFRAPPQTADHIPTVGKHVVLTFDWTWLAKVVAVYDAI